MPSPGIVQSAGTSNSSANSGATLALTGVGAGNIVLAYVSGFAISLISVPGFTQIGTMQDVNSYRVSVYYKVSSGGTESVSATYSNCSFTSLILVEVSSGTLIGSAETTQSPGSTSPDAVSVGPASPNNTGNAYVIGYSLAQVGVAPSVGTGYTSAGTYVNFGGGDIISVESRSVSSASPAATWTAQTAADLFINFVQVFDAPASPPSSPGGGRLAANTRLGPGAYLAA